MSLTAANVGGGPPITGSIFCDSSHGSIRDTRLSEGATCTAFVSPAPVLRWPQFLSPSHPSTGAPHGRTPRLPAGDTAPRLRIPNPPRAVPARGRNLRPAHSRATHHGPQDL